MTDDLIDIKTEEQLCGKLINLNHVDDGNEKKSTANADIFFWVKVQSGK